MSSADRPDFAKRLEQARILRGFGTAKDAARYFGWTYETYIQHEQGIRGIGRAAGKYAKAFRVSEAWLLTGEGGHARTLNIVGDVGAGEQVIAFDDEAMGGGEPIEAPPNVGPSAVAVRVRGNSMKPELDPGDVLVYDERHHSDFDNFIGRRVVVGLPDGRRFVKRLHKGSAPGLWRLASANPQVDDMEEVVEWVAPIKWAKMG